MVFLRRSAWVLSLFASGCLHFNGTPAPTPVELTRVLPPAGAPEPCTAWPQPIVPPGQTPPPTTEGEITLLDVRGDDRLALQGHVAFTWSPDGEKLISGSQDGVMIWSAATGVLEKRIPLPRRIENPLRLEVSPDGQWIAFVAYIERENSMAENFTGVFLMRAGGEGEVRLYERTGDSVSFTDDSRRMASYNHVWDLTTGNHKEVKPAKFDYETKFLPGRVRAIVFVRNEQTAKESVVPELRDIETGKVLHRFPPIDTSIGAAVSGDGKRLGLLHKGELSVYSLETFERVADIADVGRAQMLHLSHDGRRAVTETLMCAVALSSEARDMSWCPSPTLTLWDLDKKEKLFQTPRGAGDAWLFTPDGEYLTGPDTRLVEYIIRLRDGKELRFGSRIRSISPGSRRVLYDGKLGFEIGALDGKSPVPTFSRASKVMARSADGRWVVQSDDTGRLRLENGTQCIKLPMVVPTLWERQTLYEYFSTDDQMVFSPDASSLFVMTSANSMHRRYRAYDTSTGKERWSIQVEGRNGGVGQILPLANQVVFQGHEHPDLRRFNATTGEELPKGGIPRVMYYAPPGTALVHDVRAPEGIRSPYVYGALVGRDGVRYAMSVGLDEKCALSIWDVRNPRNVEDRFPGCMSMSKAMSPDEKWVAAGTENNRAMLIALDHDETRFIDNVREGKTKAVAYSPRGDRFVLADERGNIALIDTNKATVVGRAKLLFDVAERLLILPDGETLIVDTARGMRVRFRIRTPGAN